MADRMSWFWVLASVFEGASSGSAGQCSFQAILWLISGGPVCGLCVWLVWCCVKIGRVCCCGFVDGIRRVRCPASGFHCYVPSGGLVWNLGVNDTTVLMVVGMLLCYSHPNYQ
jgi:hypothetical protein